MKVCSKGWKIELAKAVAKHYKYGGEVDDIGVYEYATDPGCGCCSPEIESDITLYLNTKIVLNKTMFGSFGSFIESLE